MTTSLNFLFQAIKTGKGAERNGAMRQSALRKASAAHDCCGSSADFGDSRSEICFASKATSDLRVNECMPWQAAEQPIWRPGSRLRLGPPATGRPKRKRPRRGAGASNSSVCPIYCGRGTSGAACGVVALGLAGSGAAGGTGARSVRARRSQARESWRCGLGAARRERKNSRQKQGADNGGCPQPGRSLTTRRLSGFILSRASMSPLGSFIVIGHFLVVVGVERGGAESVPSELRRATCRVRCGGRGGVVPHRGWLEPTHAF